MTLVTRLVLGLLAAASVSWLAWIPVRAMYIDRHADLTERIEKCRSDIKLCEQNLLDRPRVKGEIDDFVNHTLGGDLETLDHAIRTRLNRLGETLELDDLMVSTGKTRSTPSPARLQFSGRTQKSLRDEIDFVELEGWITGRGTLEQVLHLVGQVRAEPWLKRIDQLRLEPKEGGKVIDVNLRFTTMYLPGREPTHPAESAGDDPAEFAARRVVLARDPFRIPTAKPPPPKPSPTQKPQPKAGFPYQQWVITGVAIGPDGGAEVWLLNTKSKESLNLTVGGSIGRLVLASASGERAEFTHGEKTVVLNVGDRLRPAD